MTCLHRPSQMKPRGPWGVALITVALDRDVSLLLKRVIHPAAVFEPVLRVGIFRPDAVGSSTPILCRAALVALDAGSRPKQGETKEEAQEPPTRRSHSQWYYPPLVSPNHCTDQATSWFSTQGRNR